MHRLQCRSQSYAWGKLGSKSQVAKLSLGCSNEPSIDEQKPYAELWMGTHPNGPSALWDSPEVPLSKLYPNLPYLFKVLSVGTALSIQAHPDKKLAEKLHAERPDIYKDGNHKPEMAIASSPEFETLCGFRPVAEIKNLCMKQFPEMQVVLGKEGYQRLFSTEPTDQREWLRLAFSLLMHASEESVAAGLKALKTRLANRELNYGSLEELILRLDSQYPNDVGCWCPLVLNYVVLKEGEALFLGANEPHAYLNGECIECMATSDNVIRAGLTPKYKDLPTLLSMLTYRTLPAADLIMKPQPYQPSTYPSSSVYYADVDEFSVFCTKVGPTVKKDSTPIPIPVVPKGPSIILCMKGEAIVSSNGKQITMSPGVVICTEPNAQLFAEKSDPGQDLILYQAFCKADLH